MNRKKEQAQNKKKPHLWEVKAIHSYCQLNDSELYLVEWKGYRLRECSWEPKTNLNCPFLLKEFEDKINDEMTQCQGKCGWPKRPCFSCHYDQTEYSVFFELYKHSEVRQLANRHLPDELLG